MKKLKSGVFGLVGATIICLGLAALGVGVNAQVPVPGAGSAVALSPCATLGAVFFNSAASTPGCDTVFTYISSVLTLPSAGKLFFSTDAALYRSASGTINVSSNGASANGNLLTFAMQAGALTGCQVNYSNSTLSCAPGVPIGFGTTNNSTNNAAISYVAAASIGVGNGTAADVSGTLTATNVRTVPVAVASLPACGAGTAGTHAGVTDSNAASYTAGIGAVVAAGGSTKAPVYCDGTSWRIG